VININNVDALGNIVYLGYFQNNLNQRIALINQTIFSKIFEETPIYFPSEFTNHLESSKK
jgi:hypothetical protein